MGQIFNLPVRPIRFRVHARNHSHLLGRLETCPTRSAGKAKSVPANFSELNQFQPSKLRQFVELGFAVVLPQWHSLNSVRSRSLLSIWQNTQGQIDDENSVDVRLLDTWKSAQYKRFRSQKPGIFTATGPVTSKGTHGQETTSPKSTEVTVVFTEGRSFLKKVSCRD